jgi:hypothetical protein
VLLLLCDGAHEFRRVLKRSEESREKFRKVLNCP